MKIFVEGTKRAAVSRMFPIWKDLGHSIVDNPEQANVQFSSVRVVNRGLPALLRLDGIIYDKGVDYNAKNRAISRSHAIADAVVYQSQLSKRMCEQYLAAATRATVTDVIYNGLDPAGWNNPLDHAGFNIMCCAKWRRPKRLEEIIQVFKLFRTQCPQATLHVLGVFVKNYRPIPGDNIKYYGELNFEQIQAAYQIGDAFIHMCKKDSCPSVVVEAMAAGIPVVTTNACGGATEMANLNDGCFVINGEVDSIQPDYIYQDACHQMPASVQDDLVNTLLAIRQNKTRVVFPDELRIEVVAKKYLGVLEKIAR